jgi:hypothetical protein
VHHRPEQGVIDPALRRVDVEIGRHDVEVAGPNGRRAALQNGFRVARQPVEPAQLVVEFWARRRIAVRQIEASDQDAADRRFDVPACRRDRPASRGGSRPAPRRERGSPRRSSSSARARPRRTRRRGARPREICRRAPSAPARAGLESMLRLMSHRSPDAFLHR